MEQWSPEDIAQIGKLKEAHEVLLREIHKAVVGQEQVIHQLMIALFAQGHCILVGVPGLAKTLLIRTLAASLSLQFRRVQFTPDLMPSDITGTEVIEENKTTGERSFRFIQGPIFTNMLLADEINRTPPKTQAALLEAMQELQVTVGGNRMRLSLPFFVLATQNPIEQEGTYPLPEAQLDRFMFQINVGYPTTDEEIEILDLTTVGVEPDIEQVLSGADIIALQHLVTRVLVPDKVKHYVVRLVRSTRVKEPEAPDFVNQWVAWGAGPRASQYLVLGAKANAILAGRNQITIDDVKLVTQPVLGHRVIVNFAAEAEGIKPPQIVEQLLEAVEPVAV